MVCRVESSFNPAEIEIVQKCTFFPPFSVLPLPRKRLSATGSRIYPESDFFFSAAKFILLKSSVGYESGRNCTALWLELEESYSAKVRPPSVRPPEKFNEYFRASSLLYSHSSARSQFSNSTEGGNGFFSPSVLIDEFPEHFPARRPRESQRQRRENFGRIDWARAWGLGS